MKKIPHSLFNGYEQAKLIHYNDINKNFPNTVAFEDLPNLDIAGVLKANFYVDGRLMQTYTNNETHALVIAATRLGKTTSFVIPFIYSLARQKTKKSIVISDPKGELYRLTAKELEKQGYRIRLLSLRDWNHSEYWNPLTLIYRKYVKAYNLEDEIEVIKTEDGYRNRFKGVVYDNQEKLDTAIARLKKVAFEDVANDVDKISNMICPTPSDPKIDRFWTDSAREVIKATLWGMLEDIHPSNSNNPITEKTFSIATAVAIIDSWREIMETGSYSTFDDGGYFTKRPANSRALKHAKYPIIQCSSTTRRSMMSVLNGAMNLYRTSTVQLLTSCNSFDMSELADETNPIAVFIDFPDENRTHYQLISTFVQQAYTTLIEYTNSKPLTGSLTDGKLNAPFYFILDEFGNFPPIPDFDSVISACGGRNIFFALVLQSYAQLDNVYGKEVAEIIKDNLNTHIFLGSNNPNTLSEFSKECGETTALSALSALNGTSEEIENYRFDSLPLMPKSALANLKTGECIVSEAQCGYVLHSKLERYFNIKEIKIEFADKNDYVCSINPLDDEYNYVIKKQGYNTRR